MKFLKKFEKEMLLEDFNCIEREDFFLLDPYILFPMFSLIYRKMIKDLYCIFDF
jgi:hypothetical protein